MNRFEKLARFFCACAPGIAIGLWSAHQLGFWWPVGAIVGALVSYMLVEWKEVVLAIPKAYNRATSWQPDKELWGYRGLAILGFLSVVLSSAVFLLGTAWLDSYMASGFFSGKPANAIPKAPSFFVIMNGFGIACAVFGTACLWLFTMLAFVLKRRQVGDSWLIKDEPEYYISVIKFGNPLAVFFYWPVVGLWNLPRGIGWIWENAIKKFFLFCGRFLKEFTYIIHSKKRTLCALATFITVMVGYAVDGDLITFTLVGAAIGGLYSVSSWRDWVVVKTQSQPVSA